MKNDSGIRSFAYQLYMLFFFLFLPLLLQKKVYAFGIGVYSNMHPIIASISLQLLKHVEHITVRDFHSYEYLKKNSVPVALYKDNSFLMSLKNIEDILHIDFFKQTYKSDKFHVGVSLKKPDSQKDTHMLIETIIALARQNKDTDFWLYPLDFQAAYENDEKFLLDLYERMIKGQTAQNVHIVPTDLTPEDVFSSFKLMDFFITMRLHAAIFAYRANVEFLGVTYDSKCTSFIESVGRNPYSVAELSPELVQKKLNAAKKLTTVN